MQPGSKASKPHVHFKAWLAGSALCTLTFLAAAAAGEAPAQIVHPLVGTWSWSVFGGKCVETWQYRSDGVMLITSGEAVTEWSYQVSPQASVAGFYKVEQKSVRANGKKDCSGDSTQEPGTSGLTYLQLSPAKDRYIACRAESLAACFGPLQRVR
jgi:hypothetical protein